MAEPFRILVVCTANICRSVMAERILRQAVSARGAAAEITSCGMLFDGEPASETVIDLLDERGLDARDHRSRRYTPEMVAEVDLVVAMERRHVRELVNVVDGAAPRIHTLGAIAPWLRERRFAAETTPAERVAAGAAEREMSALQGSGPDDVDDPHGRSKRRHRQTAERLDALTQALVDGLFG